MRELVQVPQDVQDWLANADPEHDTPTDAFVRSLIPRPVVIPEWKRAAMREWRARMNAYLRENDLMDVPCNTHPDAPHGFNRNQSHTLGRYVCDCEGWEPEA